MARITGYAAVYNSRSEDMGFYEELASGCFDGALRSGPDVVALYNHDPSLLLGRTASGTVQLRTDGKGLRYDVDLPDTAAARDVGELVARGDINSSSFGFICGDDDWTINTSGEMTRRIRSVAELLDVSVVTSPAYKATSVGIARSTSNESAEDAVYRERILKVCADHDYAQRALLEARLLEAGLTAEQAGAISGRQQRGGIKSQRSSFKIGLRSVTKAELIAEAGALGHEGVEQRLANAGKAERIITRGEVRSR